MTVDRRIPLLLLPGLLDDARLWRHQCETLADVASIAVADLTRGDSVAELAAQVLATAPARFALAGLSMGGYVAFEILRRAPERVLRLALFDTQAGPDTEESRRRRQEAMAAARAGGFAALLPGILGNLVAAVNRDRPEVRDVFFAMAEDAGPEVYLRQMGAIMGRPDSRPGLAAIAVPTLAIGGREDGPTPPAVMAEMAAAIPGGRYVAVEDAGHLVPLEQPQAASALLRLWLQG